MDLVNLDTLVGEHDLSAVDHETVRGEDHYDEAANCIRFVLDGRIYVAMEDPSDGYRSSMEYLAVVDGPPVKNRFVPVRVRARKADDPDEWRKNDYLVFERVDNGETVLEVGTANTDDYYPSFVGAFYADKMGEVIPPPEPVLRSIGRRYDLDDE